MGALTVTVSDSLSLSDSTPYNIGIAIYDGITLNDGNSQTANLRLHLADGILFTDSTSALSPSTSFAIAGDALNFSDGIQLTSTFREAFADTNVLTDSAIPTLNAFVVVGDSFTLSDAVGVSLVSAFVNLSVLVGETLSVSDSIGTFESGTARLGVGDSFLFQDSCTVSLGTNFNSYLRRYLNDVPTP